MAIPTVWDIPYSCGHTEQKDLSHKPAGKRAAFATWFGTKYVCSDCFTPSGALNESSTECDARDAAEAEKARADAARDGIPLDLVGSDKQIPWALKIRRSLLRDAYSALVETGQMTETEFEEHVLLAARPLDRARFWIDNRDTNAADLPELLADPGSLTAGASTENAA